jgi:hypothetical protein
MKSGVRKMKINWLDTTEAKEFGKSLAEFYMSKITPEEASGKKELDKRKEALDKIFEKMTIFTKDKKPNLYKKAQLGNAFKWTLKEAGYEEVYIDHLTRELMIIR